MDANDEAPQFQNLPSTVDVPEVRVMTLYWNNNKVSWYFKQLIHN